MTEPLDCVVIGYNEGDFQDYRAMCESTGAGSPTQQIYSKEFMEVDGRHLSWMDALSTLRNKATGRNDKYHVGEVHNLAGIYLTNFLRKAGLAAETVSLFSAEQERLADLLERGPAVVAVTTTFYVNIMPVLPVIDFIRYYAPNTHIVVGGPLVDNICLDGVTDMAQGLMHGMGADSYVVESQGETALVELTRAVQAGRSPQGLANVVTQVGGSWVSGPKKPEANDLDHATIDWSGFHPSVIGATAQTRTARSCAFKCSFCDYPQRAGALTTASVDAMRHELRAMAELGVKNLVFVDDTFNVPPKRFKELCRMLIEEDLGLNWYSYFRCSNARDEETFDLAAASGCKGVFLGIESGDQDILAAMNKLAQDSQYRNGIAQLKQRGITTFASIIVGFPGENEKTIRNTIDFLNETGPTFWRAQAWWGNPKAPVYQRKEMHGIEGSAYDWSHRTMNAVEAARWCDVMFDEVTESTWLPLYDFDFWALPYLDGKGLGVTEIKPILQVSQEIMRERSRPVPDQLRIQRLNEQLYKAVAAVDMAPSRFEFATT